MEPFQGQGDRQGQRYTLNELLIFQLGAGLAAVLGMLGLMLALVGVYGVGSYAAEQRTAEIGIRLAVGAQPSGLLLLILREGLRTSALVSC